MENSTTKFRRSYICLQKFLDNWTGKIHERCLGNEQRKASFYVWCRYTISIHTFHRICKPHCIPDIYVIARSCLEYDASLKGIIADPQLAKDYLEFPDKAKAYYVKLLERLGDTAESAKLEPGLKKVLGSDWRQKASMKWHKNGISELIEQHGGPNSRRLYAWWSHFAHGSAVSVEMLQRTVPTQDQLDTTVAAVYGAYALSTSDFLDFAWGPVLTPDGESCKSDFDHSVIGNWI
ncbi:MAG: DUF5677 domain-containing protein [Planctomycetota bacterium]